MSLTQVKEGNFEKGSTSEPVMEMAEEVFDREGVYLSGAIMNSNDNGHGWREDFTEEYSDEFEINNPLDLYDPDEVDILKDPLDFDPDSEKEQIFPSEYVAEDKFMILQSEYIFVGLEDEVTRGSMMECMYGYMHDIPFFVWTIDDQKESGWVYDHAEIVNDNMETVVEAIRKY